jgi:recombinational DNA repair protein RecR
MGLDIFPSTIWGIGSSLIRAAYQIVNACPKQISELNKDLNRDIQFTNFIVRVCRLMNAEIRCDFCLRQVPVFPHIADSVIHIDHLNNIMQ